MKQLFLVPLFLAATACFSQKQISFKDEQGKTQTLMIDDHFQSLSPEVIQELYKINPSLGEFLHLATDKTKFYFLTNVAQLQESKKNEFYQLLFNSGFSFQVGHDLPEGYVWVISPNNELKAEDCSRKISNLFIQINN